MPRPMKNSGVEWIGEIPADWKILRNKVLFYEVNERCTDANHYKLLSVSEYTGITPRSAIIKDGEYETHAETLDGYKICRAGDIVMNIMLAWKRATATSSYNGIVSPAYCVFRGKGVDTKYFHYLFRTDNCADMFKRYSTGIIDSRLRLYPNVFFSLKSIVPPLDEQQRIATFLDSECARIDSVIEKTRASIEEYKKLKQALITRAVTKGIRPDRTLKHSGIEWLGDIPADWSMCRLRFLCDILTGNQDTQDNDPNGEYPFYVRSPIVERSNKYTFEGDAILMAGDGVGAGKVFHYVSGKYGCHQRVYSLQNIRGIARRFLYYYLQNRFYVSIETANSKSTVDSVRLIMLKNFPILIPPLEEQEEIAAYLDGKTAAIDSLVAKKNQLAEELESLKKSLIFEYVTGKKEITR